MARFTNYRGAVAPLTKLDRAIAARVARRIGLRSGTRLLRPKWHNPSPAFTALVPDEHSREDRDIIDAIAGRHCPLTYWAHLNR